MSRRPKIVAMVTVALIWFGSVGTQVALYVYREELGSAFSGATEQQLYLVPPYIEWLKHDRFGHLDLRVVSKDAIKVWHENLLSLRGNRVQIALSKGQNRIKLTIGGKPHHIVVEYFPAEVYKKAESASSLDGVVIVRESTLAMERPVVSHIEEWAPVVDKTSATFLEGQYSPTGPEEIISKLIVFLEGRRGFPDHEMLAAGLQGVRAGLAAGGSPVWCSQIALLTSGALSPRFVVRLVTSSGRVANGNVMTGGHTFNEILDPESGDWMLLDPTNYVVGVRWKNGKPISAVGMRRLLSMPQESWAGAVTFSFWNSERNEIVRAGWETVPQRIRDDLHYQFSPLNSLRYFSSTSAVYRPSLGAKLQDWASLEHRFKLEETRGYGMTAYLRIWTFWLMLALAPLFVFSVVAWLRSAKRG